MDESDRTPRYRKDEGREALLRALNDQLAPLQESLDAGLVAPQLPVLFIIGTPRSGSTLLSQLLVRSGVVGYVSNFVARFWRAPLVGARIEAALGTRDAEVSDPFSSEHGVTRGWSMPHEFGYFWDQWFDRGQSTHKLSSGELGAIDVGTLRRRVASLEAAYGLPMSFKNNTWCSLQADWLAGCFPTAAFLVCRRDPVYVAQSIALARRARLGSVDRWWSMRPSSYERIRTLPWWEQVAAQVLEIEREMDEALQGVAASRRVEVPYTDLCRSPRQVFARIAGPLALAGAATQPLRELPERFDATDRQRLDDDEWQRVVSAVARIRERGLPV